MLPLSHTPTPIVLGASSVCRAPTHGRSTRNSNESLKVWGGAQPLALKSFPPLSGCILNKLWAVWSSKVIFSLIVLAAVCRQREEGPRWRPQIHTYFTATRRQRIFFKSEKKKILYCCFYCKYCFCIFDANTSDNSPPGGVTAPPASDPPLWLDVEWGNIRYIGLEINQLINTKQNLLLFQILNFFPSQFEHLLSSCEWWVNFPFQGIFSTVCL